MFELTYTSLATITIDNSQLVRIEKISKQRNSELDVTGCLFYHAGRFIGILEGTEDALEMCFANTKQDTTYKEVSILAMGRILERQFDQWNILFCSKEDKNDAEYRLLLENLHALTELADKRTYGSRVFWGAVQEELQGVEAI